MSAEVPPRCGTARWLMDYAMDCFEEMTDADSRFTPLGASAAAQRLARVAKLQQSCSDFPACPVTAEEECSIAERATTFAAEVGFQPKPMELKEDLSVDIRDANL